MPLPESRKNANEKYLNKLDDIKLRVPKGKREEIQRYAKSNGESVNSYIKKLIESDSGIKL